MSTPSAAWKRNSFRLVADGPRRPKLDIEARDGLVRVLVLTPDGHPAMAKLGEPTKDGSGAWVSLLGKRLLATRFDGHPDAPGCRHVVSMPPREVA